MILDLLPIVGMILVFLPFSSYLFFSGKFVIVVFFNYFIFCNNDNKKYIRT